MAVWRDYAALYPGAEHTVTGIVKVCQGVVSPQLDNRRDVLVYLPPAYATSSARYPVIYFHDGQNVFDAATSFSGEWGADETLEALAGEGLAAIAVALPNLDGLVTGTRLDEYSPWRSTYLDRGGLGNAYLAFIVETVKPLIDAAFRTQPDRAHTHLVGSSMGGLISLYGFQRYADIFGGVGVFSPAFWFADDDAPFRYTESAPFRGGRVYMDIGTQEVRANPDDPGVPAITSATYLEGARRMVSLLRAKGYRDGVDLLYIEDEGAIHHESAWARRLPDALRFLLHD